MNNEMPLREYYPALTGLRGCAILLVILYHNFNFIEYFNYGWLGVDLFFVLSGFLITDILLNSINSEHYFKNFYARRVLRIFPLYYLSLVLFLFIIPAIAPNLLNMAYYQDHQVWFWTYLQNWPLIFKEDTNANALNHYWSLAIEEQYYLLWPLLVLLLRKPKRIILFCTVMLAVVIAARVYIWNNAESFPSYERAFLFTRIDGILIGSLLAALCNINSTFLRKYFTTVLVVLTAVNYIYYLFKKNQNPGFPSWAIAGFTTFSLVFAMAIYEAIMKENKLLNFILTNRVLRFLGKYSYGIYIFHWPVALMTAGIFTSVALVFFEKGSLIQQITTASLCTLTAIAVSVISYYAFEVHFLRLKKYFSGALNN